MRRLLTLLSSMLVCVAVAKAQNVEQLKTRLKQASLGNALTADGLLPWHMQMAVTLYDEKGVSADEGIIEEWWKGPGEYKISFQTKHYARVEVERDNLHTVNNSSGTPPNLLKVLLSQVVQPVLPAQDIEDSTPVLKKENFGKVSLECLMLSRPVKNMPNPPIGLFPTYCFDPGQNTLRASFELGTESILRNKIGRFENRTIATEISIRGEKNAIADAHVTVLKTEDMPDDLFQPQVRHDAAERIVVAQNVASGAAISQPQPVYPMSAKQARLGGTVVLHGLIGSDGRVAELRVISTPDPALAYSAVSAVHQWRYKPYILEGQPVEVETTITVNYQIE